MPEQAGQSTIDLTTVRDNSLIIDFGMHKGLDTAFYLAKGFRVVAIEANPLLVKEAKERFRQEIESGALMIEAVGVAPRRGVLTFYSNLDVDEWSSFERHLGTRQNTRYDEILIDCVTPLDIFNKYGIPYFCKIDIEGYDRFVVHDIGRLPVKPKYISVEDGGMQVMIDLFNISVPKYKLLNQIDKNDLVLPNPPLEGKYAPVRFGPATSGPFGEEVPGEWMSFDRAMLMYLTEVRPPGQGVQGGWWDIHGRFD